MSPHRLLAVCDAMHAQARGMERVPVTTTAAYDAARPEIASLIEVGEAYLNYRRHSVGPRGSGWEECLARHDEAVRAHVARFGGGK